MAHTAVEHAFATVQFERNLFSCARSKYCITATKKSEIHKYVK